MLRVYHYYINSCIQPFKHIAGHFKVPDMGADKQPSALFGHHFPEMFLAFVSECEFSSEACHHCCFVKQYPTEDVIIPVYV